MTPPTNPTPAPLELGELNVRHLNRRVGTIEAKQDETHKLILTIVVPGIAAIAERVGAAEYTVESLKSMPATAAPVLVVKPPRIPWWFAAAISFSSALLALVGAHLIYGA